MHNAPKAIIFTRDNQGVAVPVTDLFTGLAVAAAASTRIWGGEAFFLLVEGETEGTYYPLPLIFGTQDERQAAAAEAGLPAPSEAWVRSKWGNVQSWINSGGLSGPDLHLSLGDPDKLAAVRPHVYLQNDPRFVNYDFHDFDDAAAELIALIGAHEVIRLIHSFGYTASPFGARFTIHATHANGDAFLHGDERRQEEAYRIFIVSNLARLAEDDEDAMGLSAYPLVNRVVTTLRSILANLDADLSV